MLLSQDQLQLSEEFDFYLTASTFDICDFSNVSSLCSELRLKRIKRVAFRCELIAVLRVEKLWVSPVKVITQVIIRDVCEVEKFKQLNWLFVLFHHVVVDAVLFCDWVLSGSVV